MNTTIFSQNLAKALGLATGVMEKKSTIPVLSNLLIEPNGANSVRVTATDLDVTLITVVEVEEIGEGSEQICVPGKKLNEILRTFPGNTLLEFKKEKNNWVNLKAGNAKFKIAGVDGSQFPEVPTMPSGNKSKAFSISATLLSRLIEMTQFAITNEQSRFTLSGAKLMVEKGIVRMVATDGHRLSLTELKNQNESDVFDALIPKKALSELLRACRDTNADALVKIDVDPNHLFFEIGDTQIITRKLSGTFPNYEMVIPKDNNNTFAISPEILRTTLMRVRLMADERTSAVKFEVKKGALHLDAISSEEGEAHEQIAIDYQGDEITFGINSNYGTDYLPQIINYLNDRDKETFGQENSKPLSKNIVFHLKDGNNQVMVKLEDETEITSMYVLMPLRI